MTARTDNHTLVVSQTPLKTSHTIYWSDHEGRQVPYTIRLLSGTNQDLALTDAEWNEIGKNMLETMRTIQAASLGAFNPDTVKEFKVKDLTNPKFSYKTTTDPQDIERNPDTVLSDDASIREYYRSKYRQQHNIQRQAEQLIPDTSPQHIAPEIEAQITQQITQDRTKLSTALNDTTHKVKVFFHKFLSRSDQRTQNPAPLRRPLLVPGTEPHTTPQQRRDHANLIPPILRVVPIPPQST
jgi:hypothetical protein